MFAHALQVETMHMVEVDSPMGSRQLPAAGHVSTFGLTPPSHAMGLMDIVSTPAPMPMV